MDIQAAKDLVDGYRRMGKTRLQTIDILSSVPLNGEASEAFEYVDLVYQSANSFNLTDLGNAERLMSQHGEHIKYCYDRNRWLLWKETHWQWDNGDEIMKIAQLTVRTIYEEAAHEEDKKFRDELAKWAKTSESNQRINAMVSQAEPMAAIKLDDLDKDYWLLNCQNGTVNLKTGELQPHDRLDYQTLICPFNFDSTMPHPIWDSFLNRICKENSDLIAYLQRCMGYCLTGDTREQILFFIHGPGQNGKTTFLETLSELLGPYGTQANIEMFLSQYKPQSSGHSEDLANLAGKRLVIASEIEEGRRLATAKLKQITGGEKVRASHKYEREFEYQVTYKIWLNGNHKPDILDTTYSIWRRVKLILLDVVIPPEERDRHLREKLRSEYPGIMAWAVRGCVDWQKIGLSDPVVVSNAVRDYRQEQDVLSEFFATNCVLAMDAEYVVSHKELFTAYQSWCQENSIDPIASRNFAKKLKEKNEIQKFMSHGQIKWRYIRLLKEGEEPKRVDEGDEVGGFLKSPLYLAGFHENSLGNTSTSSTLNLKRVDEKQGLVSNAENSVHLPHLPKNEISSTQGQNSGYLPDCPDCGEWDWVFDDEGRPVCNNCGKILEQ